MTHAQASKRTKSALADALKQLMEKKPFSKITVTEVITLCNVNRKTFYYHFTDLYALLTWTLEVEAVEVVKSFDLLTDPEEAIDFIIQYTSGNRHILNCALDSVGRDQLKRFLYTDFTSIVGAIIDEQAREMQISVSASYREFLTAFWTEALASLLIVWLQDGIHIEKKKARAYLSATIKNGLPAMLAQAPQ